MSRFFMARHVRLAPTLRAGEGINPDLRLNGRPSSVSQESPARRLPTRRLPRSRIPSVHPDGCCRKRDRSSIENPCVSYLLPSLRLGLEQGCNRSPPESETLALWRDLPRA